MRSPDAALDVSGVLDEPTLPSAPRGALLRRWYLVAGSIAISMLLSILVIGALSTPDNGLAASSLVDTDQGLPDMVHIMQKNFLVLGIHLCACWIGALVVAKQRNVPDGWNRMRWLNSDLPDWVRTACLGYALFVTISSIVLQTFALGLSASAIASDYGMQMPLFIALLAPHALVELTAVFLPLAAFLWRSRRDQLAMLGHDSWVCAAYAIPMICLAAAWEVWVTPHLLLLFIGS